MSGSTELTFVRCPSCRSLVPAVSTRCRMCGTSLQGDGPQESAEERRSARVRQRTASVSSEEADRIRDNLEPVQTQVENTAEGPQEEALESETVAQEVPASMPEASPVSVASIDEAPSAEPPVQSSSQIIEEVPAEQPSLDLASSDATPAAAALQESPVEPAAVGIAEPRELDVSSGEVVPSVAEPLEAVISPKEESGSSNTPSEDQGAQAQTAPQEAPLDASMKSETSADKRPSAPGVVSSSSGRGPTGGLNFGKRGGLSFSRPKSEGSVEEKKGATGGEKHSSTSHPQEERPEPRGQPADRRGHRGDDRAPRVQEAARERHESDRHTTMNDRGLGRRHSEEDTEADSGVSVAGQNDQERGGHVQKESPTRDERDGRDPQGSRKLNFSKPARQGSREDERDVREDRRKSDSGEPERAQTRSQTPQPQPQSSQQPPRGGAAASVEGPERRERPAAPEGQSGSARERPRDGGSNSQAPRDRGSMRESRTIAQPIAQSQGRLFGWLVSYLDSEGAAIELREGKMLVTGSSLKQGDLVLDDPSISTPHAMITVTPTTGFIVQDLISERGVWIRRGNDDTYHREEDSVQVHHGDWIRLGDVEFLVSLIAHVGVK